MAIRVNTNIAALNAAAQNSFNRREISDSVEHLSSGLRINKAADDASGMSIADSLRSQANSLGQSIKNANDAIGLIQIADKAMDEQLNILKTIKLKATQAAQDGQTIKTRQAIQADIAKLTAGLDSIASTTSYNGQKLLSGGYTRKAFQIGASSNQTINLSVGATNSGKIGHVRVETTQTISASINISCTTLNFKVGSRSIGINGVRISTSAGTGIGALAEKINRFSDKTGIRTYANTKSQASQSVTSGNVENLVLNGVTIGNIDNVKANDSDGRLVLAINSVKEQTGVEASIDTQGRLELTSIDGRGIYLMSKNLREQNYQQVDLALNQTGNYVNPNKVNEGVITAGFQIIFNDELRFTTSEDYSTVAGSAGGNGPQSEFGEWLDGVVRSVTGRGGATANSNVGFAINQFLNEAQGEGATITMCANGTEIEDILNIHEGDGSFGEGARISECEGSSGELSLGEERVMHITGTQASNFGRLTMISQGSEDITVTATTNSSCTIFQNNSEGSANLQSLLGVWDESMEFATGATDIAGNVGVTTIQGAMLAMDIADSAIAKLSSIRSDLGSAQIQIASTLNNIAISQVNVKAAEATIRDIDFAKASEQFNKRNILIQSGSYALGQANFIQRNILLLFA